MDNKEFYDAMSEMFAELKSNENVVVEECNDDNFRPSRRP